MQTINNISPPNTKNEKWKYTNIEKFLGDRLFETTKITPAKNPDFSFSNASENSQVASILKHMDSQLADEYFYHLSNKENVFVTILEGNYEKPLLSQQNGSKNIHNIYIAKKNSNASFFEEYASSSSDITMNITSSFFLEENAHINFVQLTEEDDKKILINNVRGYVSKNANFESVIISKGCKLVRNNIDVKLDGENANSSVHGVYKIGGESHFDTSSYIEHASPRSYSSQLYKGIMDDRSHGIFTGLIKVNKDSQEINSNQLNKNLLLSNKAHCHSRPQLEIFADDVKCSHGSTTGQLSDEQLFYFEARGIPREKAQKILGSAFINDVLLKIKDQSIREIITQKFHLLHEEL